MGDAAIIVGGSAGALIRYAVATWWPQPIHLLMSTAVITAAAFAVAGYLLTTGHRSTLGSALLGMCAAAASLSAYGVLTVNQPPLLSIAFLISTPAAGLAGLVCGLVAARSTWTAK